MSVPTSAARATSNERNVTMVRATWHGTVIAESDDTMVVEGNHYFPRASVRAEHLRDSPKHTTCHWKGVASYYDVVVDDEVNSAAAWYYPQPLSAAERITDHIAFWKGVKVSDGPDGDDGEHRRGPLGRLLRR